MIGQVQDWGRLLKRGISFPLGSPSGSGYGERMSVWYPATVCAQPLMVYSHRSLHLSSYTEMMAQVGPNA